MRGMVYLGTSQPVKQTLFLQTRFGRVVVFRGSLVRSLLIRHHLSEERGEDTYRTNGHSHCDTALCLGYEHATLHLSVHSALE